MAPRTLTQISNSVKAMKRIKFLKHYPLSQIHSTALTPSLTIILPYLSLKPYLLLVQETESYSDYSLQPYGTVPFLTLTFPRNMIKSPKQLMDANSAELFAKIKTASFADVQKLVPFMAVVVYTC